MISFWVCLFSLVAIVRKYILFESCAVETVIWLFAGWVFEYTILPRQSLISIETGWTGVSVKEMVTWSVAGFGEIITGLILSNSETFIFPDEFLNIVP